VTAQPEATALETPRQSLSALSADWRPVYVPVEMEIDLAAIGTSLAEIRRRAGGQRKVIAVLKADAYGHSCVAASRRDAPSSTPSSTRSRKSLEQDLGMALPQEPTHPSRLYLFASQGNPRFNSDGNRSSDPGTRKNHLFHSSISLDRVPRRSPGIPRAANYIFAARAAR
jgi:hypothetical protein